MHAFDHLDKAYQSAKRLNFDDSHKMVFISDCHRGDASFADNFIKNRNLYAVAMNYYFKENYIYFELGDGDELWENKKIEDIIKVHSDVYHILYEFYKRKRLYFLYGNHDMVKRDRNFAKKNYYNYYDDRTKQTIPLFRNIQIHEGILLEYAGTDNKILLIHGHQADFFNDRAWKLSRFLVRHLWRPLQLIGVHDPFSASKNPKQKEKTEHILTEWVKREKVMIIAGHTHRTMFPDAGKPPYFNDGSCVHPRCITAIEICDGCVSLIKWSVKTKPDGTLYIGKDVLGGPERLRDYF